MGIRDRDYMKDWEPPDEWEAESEQPRRWRRKRPWTPMRILAWVSIGLLILAIVLVALLRPT